MELTLRDQVNVKEKILREGRQHVLECCNFKTLKGGNN